MRWVNLRIFRGISTTHRTYRPRQMTRLLSMQALFRETPVNIPAELEVKLTPEEDRLCTLLDECKRDLGSRGTNVECRIAGGWVRDKLLGSQSDDIDIALANMMGVAFAEEFVSFLSSKDIPVRSIHKIERNPEQSKHLETAHTKVLGFEVDFVNLRSEEYTGDSRIPTEIKLGTPLEDALRRDVTFNALFYNVHTRAVEDFTRKGLDDLRNGILRTPLPPKETFMDDPLRVLRCIRFASRYGFKLSEEVEEAAKDPQIQAAIISKISKERVGIEFEKMMSGRDPVQSMRLMTSLGLQTAVFALPLAISSTLSQEVSSKSLGLAACVILRSILSSPSTLELPVPHPLLLSQLSVDPGLRQRLFFAAALSSYRDIKYKTPKGETRPAVEAIIREALKRGQQNHFSDGIPAFFAAAEILRHPTIDNAPGENERSEIGLLLRNKCSHNKHSGSHWSSSLLFSLVQELTSLWNPETETFDAEAGANIVETYNKLTRRIEELGLPESIDEKPLLNGKEIISALGASKSGPWLGSVLTSMEAWQLDHPGASREDCEAWLIGQKDAGHIIVSSSSSSSKPTKKEKDADGPSSKKAKLA